MENYICSMCGWEYDPARGFPVFGVKPGTSFEDLPDEFCCPVCGARKVHFMPRNPSRRDASPRSTD